MNARFTFLSGARVGQVETFRKSYIGLGRHPLSDVRFDPERDIDVSARHAEVVRQGVGFLLRDLGSTNGTFVNGTRITGDVALKGGDVITFGRNGPRVEFHVVADEPVRRSSTAVRIAAEVARQTIHLRRTTKLLIVLLAATLVAFGWVERNSAREATARSTHDAATLARLSAQLDSAEARQRRLAGAAAVDYRAIAQQNQDAVALLVVAFSEREIFSGTAFAVDSQGTLVTNKHVLVGADGERRPERIQSSSRGAGSGSRAAWWASPIPPTSASCASTSGAARRASRDSPARPAPWRVGIPWPSSATPSAKTSRWSAWGRATSWPTPLTVGTVSKVLAGLAQVDGYGAPGSSGSPMFDRAGRVAGVLYCGNPTSAGEIIYAVPAHFVVEYLRRLR